MATDGGYKDKIEKGPEGDIEVRRQRTVVSDPPAYYYNHSRFAGYRILYFLLDILEVLLAVRFLFRLLAANPGSPFVALLYQITGPFVAPFRGIFRPAAANGSVLEWSTLVAMIIYALIVYAIVRLIDIASSPA